MTENSPNSADDLGNTKTKSSTVKRQDSAALRWSFTWNNPSFSSKDLETLLKKYSKKFIFQLEEGDHKIPHYQGYIVLKKRARLTELKKLIHNGIHFEKCKGNEEQNVEYCSKLETKIDGPWYYNLTVEEPLELIENLYPWQQYIVDMVRKKPDKRSIVWIYEPKGNMGKTQLCKYLSHHYGAIPLEGKKNDILYCAAMFPSKIYIYDLERSMEDYVSYASIEKIKNAYYMCAKYESKPINRNSPHVLIFSNFPPDTSQLSKDRWVIINLEELNRTLVNKLELVSQNAFKDIEPEYDITFD